MVANGSANAGPGTRIPKVCGVRDSINRLSPKLPRSVVNASQSMLARGHSGENAPVMQKHAPSDGTA